MKWSSLEAAADDSGNETGNFGGFSQYLLMWAWMLCGRRDGVGGDEVARYVFCSGNARFGVIFFMILVIMRCAG